MAILIGGKEPTLLVSILCCFILLCIVLIKINDT